ncbi:protein Peter pan [Galendromus occidentalis]|uniref:Protein Peter pan n=1 Tax=Galendromus occidentalis TaxID=34638 RepID=A0AAJ6QQ69_9ACAR|nr:protein Peter pan [Galendromus occidentalis]
MVHRIVTKRPKTGRYFSDEQLKGPDDGEAQHLIRAPHTFVITQGKSDRVERELCADVRKVMEPFTASKLKTKRKNTVKDFVAMAGFFHVTHMLVLSKTTGGKMFLRVMHLPRGPTLTFEIRSFTTAALVRKTLKKVVQMANRPMSGALLIQNNFLGPGMHFKLMSTMFQNMLPSININKVNLNNVKRCLLLNYNGERDVVEWRHYAIKVVPTGIAKAAKRLLDKKIPKLGNLTDISDFVDNPDASESEADELLAGTNRVICPEGVSARGNIPGKQSALKLYELGPRLTLKLVKIHSGLCEGTELYGQDNVIPELPQYQTKPEDIAPPPKKRKRPEKVKKTRTPQEKHAAKMQRRKERQALDARKQSQEGVTEQHTAENRPMKSRSTTAQQRVRGIPDGKAGSSAKRPTKRHRRI